MPLVQITDHVDRATARLLQQYRDATAPGVQEVVQALAFEVQDIEDALFKILDETTLSAAVGLNLERLGALVGQARNGMADETYWLWIQTRIKANKCSGSIDQILEIFMLLNSGATLQFVEQFPAAFTLKVNGIAVASPLQQAAILRVARKAGVAAVLEYSTAPAGAGFCFSGGTGLGFPDAVLTPGSGGKLAGAAR